MREIKHRVWDKQYEKFVKSLILLDPKGQLYERTEDDFLTKLDMERFIVERDTGLKDKNGKEIYEGDIVKVYYRNTRWKLCGKYGVFWDSLNAHYVLSKSEDIDEADFVLGGLNYKYEVIGNIHENSELLGGQE